jgi:hypothetical protein
MKTISVIIAPALIVGITFWCLWGHDLRMNVYANNEFWYDEAVSLLGKVLVSVFIGLAASAIVAGYLGGRRVIHNIRKNVAGGTSMNPTDY